MKKRLTLYVVVLLLTAISIPQRVHGLPSRTDRVTEAVDNTRTTMIRGNVHRLVRREFDAGLADDSFPLKRIVLMFKPTPAQQAELDSLLQQQADPSSPNYHKWLAPEQYADRFGVSVNDLNTVTNWLKAQGLTVDEVARSRTWVAFSGSVRQVSAALHTEIHHYTVNGIKHYANAKDPSLPSAFAGIVMGIRFLDDFKPAPRAFAKAVPSFTSSVSGKHFLAPDDFATIYNVKGLYNSGIDGTRQKIAVVGQTDVVQSDIDAFRSAAGLPTTNLQIVHVPGSPDPGVVTGDIVEADLDIEWSGAVARNATIVYVNSGNGAFDALTFAITNNVAPVISISYGGCEQGFTATEIASLTVLGQQANAQGQTIVAATGDSGAADCDSGTPTAPITSATHGLAVDIPAALPFVTGTGGGEFSEGSGTFWNTTNNSNGGSAISYIPERAWNDTANGGSLSSGGGGRSLRFSKPVWQVGNGVPNDNARDVPDVSLSASPAVDGYLVCSQGRCVNGFRAADSTLDVIGGTSASAPSLAGIIALINQMTNSTQGNLNPSLYAIAGSSPAAFHDITSGDNKVPCTAGTPDCPAGTTSIGFAATPGYDLATGLGSVDASALASALSGSSSAGFQLSFGSSSVSLARGTSTTVPGVLTAVGAFNGSVVIACSASSSLVGVTCTATPDPASPGNPVTLTITSSQTAALYRGGSHSSWPSLGLVIGGLLLVGSQKKYSLSRKQLRVVIPCALLLMLGGAVSCGGVSSSQTTVPVIKHATNGLITVDAASGSLTRRVQLSVTLN